MFLKKKYLAILGGLTLSGLVYSNDIGMGGYELQSDEAIRQSHGQKSPDLSGIEITPIGLSRLGITGETLAELRRDESQSPIMMSAVANRSLPSEVDNSTLKYFPPIGNQGASNSCVAYSMTYYTFSYMNALNHDMDISNGDNTRIFSPKFTYNLGSNGTLGGVSPNDVENILETHGALTLSELPYNCDNNNPVSCREWPTAVYDWIKAMDNRLESSSYFYLSSDLESVNDSRLVNMKSLLTNGYILNFGTAAGSFVYGGTNGVEIKDDISTSLDDQYLSDAIVYARDGDEVGHYLTVVGYNDNIWVDINKNNIVDDGEKGALKIANSWGSNWKNGGFVWIAYDALNEISLVSNATTIANRERLFDGGYRLMTVKKEYEPTLIAQFTLNTQNRTAPFISNGVSAAANDFVSLGVQPQYESTFYPGACSYDGTQNASDITMAMDLTELTYNDGSDKNWYLNVSNWYNSGQGPTLIKDFALYDPINNFMIRNNSTVFPISVLDEHMKISIAYTKPVDVTQRTIKTLLTSPNSADGGQLYSSMIPIGNKLYGYNSQDSLICYDVASNSWEQERALAGLKYGITLTSHNGKLFATGRDNSNDGKIYSFNEAQKSWTLEKSLDTYGLRVAGVGKYICLTSINKPVGELTLYDTETKSIQTIQPEVPGGETVKALFGGKTQLYYDFGGDIRGFNVTTQQWEDWIPVLVDDVDKKYLLNDIFYVMTNERYLVENYNDVRWKVIDTLPKKGAFEYATFLNNDIYFFQNVSHKRLGITERYSLLTPTLTDTILAEDFESGWNGWQHYVDWSATSEAYVMEENAPNNALHVYISDLGTETWHVHARKDNVTLENGKTYKVTFDARAESGLSRDIIVKLEEYGGNWTNYSNAPAITIDGSMKTYSFTFTMANASDPAAGLCFEMGKINGNTPVDVVIDNITVEKL